MTRLLGGLWLVTVTAGACQETPATTTSVSLKTRAADVVTRGDITPRLLLTGEIDAVDSADLTVPRTQTFLLAIRWMEKEGTVVKKGQKVVELDNSTFTNQLEETKLQVEQAVIDLATEVAVKELDVNEKSFKVDAARIALDKARLDAMVPEESIPRRVHQERQLALKRAQVALAKAEDEAQAAKKMASLDVQIKHVELDKTKRQIQASEEAIEAMVLRAPRDGMVVIGNHPWEGHKFQVGENARPGWAVAKIPDLSRMEVRATMSDVDDGRIAVGTKVRCTMDAYPDLPFSGVIEELTPIAREPTQGSLRRNYSLRIALQEQGDKRMRPGLSVRVDVPQETLADALLVPRAALDMDGKKPRALLAGGASREVKLGACDAHRCVILAGLKEGQRLRRRRRHP